MKKTFINTCIFGASLETIRVH